MERNRILYWGRMQLPDKNALAHRVIANCCALRQCGYVPILLGYTKEKTERHIIETKYEVAGFDSYELAYPQKAIDWAKDAFAYKSIEKILNHYGPERFRAIVYTGVGVGNNHGLSKLSKKYNIPLVRDIVDWFEYNNGTLLYRLIKQIETKVTVDYYTPRAHNVICISTYLKNYFDKKDCNTLLVPSLSNRFDPRFSNLPQYRREGSLNVVYVGNPGKKGDKDRIDWCVAAFLEEKKKCSLHICGISKEEFCRDFPEYLGRVDAENIIFYGKIPNRRCVELIAKADYFVFARENKQATKAGFPTKFSEALAIGTPIITTPAGDVAIYLNDGINGYIADDCSYQTFLMAWKRALSADDSEIVKMHELLRGKSPLFEDEWIDQFKNYFDKL